MRIKNCLKISLDAKKKRKPARSGEIEKIGITTDDIGSNTASIIE